MSIRLLPLAAVYLLFTALPACGHDHDHDHPHDPAGATDAGHEHEHALHVEMGNAKVGALSIRVVRVAALTPGAEGDFDLEFGDQKLPTTVRGWIGLEDGQGARKVLFEKETEQRMHGHPPVPKVMVEGSRLWLEVEGVGKASLELK